MKKALKIICTILFIIGIIAIMIVCLMTNDKPFDNITPYKELLYDLLSSDFVGYTMVIISGVLTCLVLYKEIEL